jgi:hypothetical protein
MSLTVNDFRASSAELGKAYLQADNQQAALVQGGIGAWIKSLLNIGDARATNARTLDALRQAVHNDPQYARITEQAGALLGRMSASSPLTGKKVSQFLAQMDTAAAKADAAAIIENKALVSSIAMREMPFLDAHLKEMEKVMKRDFTLDPSDMSKLNSVIKDRILAAAGDFRNTPNADAIRDIVRFAAYDFAYLHLRLDRADLPQNVKNIVRSKFFQDGALITRQQLDEKINIRLNVQSNQRLEQSLTDISRPDSPLRAALGEALEKAGITAPMSDRAIAGLAGAIGSAVDKAGKHGQHMVSPEEGQAILAARVKTVVDAYQIAGTLGTSKESAFLQNLALNSPNPVSPAYLEALAERAGAIPKEAFTAISSASNPKQFLDAVENLGDLLQTGFESLDQSLKLEGSGGHQSYMGHCLSLALLHAGIDQGGAQTLFDGLNTPLGTEMRTLFSFGAQVVLDPAMASKSSVMLRTLEALGHIAGIDVDAFMEAEDQRQVPQQASGFSLEARALLPGYQPVQGNIQVERSPDLAAARETAGQKLASDMSTIIPLEMKKHLDSNEPTFEKDITRDGPKITLGGTTLPRFFEIPEALVLKPGETLESLGRAVLAARENKALRSWETLENLGEGVLTERRKQVAVADGYNVFAKFVTGRDDAVFSALAPEDKTRALILTSLANQVMEQSAQIYCLQSVAPRYMDGTDDSIALVLDNSASQRTIDIHKNPNGDFVIRCNNDTPLKAASLPNSGTSMLDTRSGCSIASSLTISGAEMDRLSTLNWNPGKGKSPPQITFSEHSMIGELRLFKEEKPVQKHTKITKGTHNGPG